jgi:hypothetical protein
LNRIGDAALSALLVLCLAGCGKIGPPLPPIVAVPRPIDDLRVAQAGYDLRFDWTNPRLHVDQTPIVELTRLVMRAGEEVVLDVPAGDPGGGQSAILRDVRDQIGSTLAFSVEVAGRDGGFSQPSPVVSLTIVEVPGAISGLGARVDEGVVALRWGPSPEGAGLIDRLRVYRGGVVRAELPSTAQAYEDAPYVPGQTYAYRVVAVRSAAGGLVEGVEGPTLSVVAQDDTAPQTPSGLTLRVENGQALLTWASGTERDLAGYRVYRREAEEGSFVQLSPGLVLGNGFADQGYQPGMAYTVTALDETGNESDESAPVS